MTLFKASLSFIYPIYCCDLSSLGASPYESIELFNESSAFFLVIGSQLDVVMRVPSSRAIYLEKYLSKISSQLYRYIAYSFLRLAFSCEDSYLIILKVQIFLHQQNFRQDKRLIIIMEFIPLLKLRKNAMRDCSQAEQFPLERRLKLKQKIEILEAAPWVSKGVVLLAIVLGVNWKKQVPITKRELPLAVGAIGFCALTDFLVNEWAWRQHEVEIVRLTGFKNGIYVNPQRMRRMRLKMQMPPQMKDLDDDLLIEDDMQTIK